MRPVFLFLLLFLLTVYNIYGQNRYDVVIDELMVDPSPSNGLPNYEWIELKNTGSTPVNLFNWRIGDAGGQSGAMPPFLLQPDSFVIVCSNTAITAMNAWGTTIAVSSFPSLANDAGQLFLKAANGQIIHALNYTNEWYHNDVKKDGGWTMEMIDTKNPCTGIDNWKASTNTTGGTPGGKNTADAINRDDTGPQLLRAFTTDNSTIILVLNEPVDSLSGATITNYVIDGSLSFISAVTIAPLFNEVLLKTSSPLMPNTVYTIIANQVKDCKNNSIGTVNKVKIGLPADPLAGEWIINEILFNPRPAAFDYIEFYNNSLKILDAAKLFIAGRNSSGAIISVKPLSATAFYIFPGDHIAITEDAANLAVNYFVAHPDHILVIPSLPSFPDDAGDVIALNLQGTIIDEVRYKKEWHFKLISQDEGIALERIDPNGISQDPSNWHSAASTAGYGTPTYKNSQYKQPGIANSGIVVVPKIFSPDNDGRDDFVTIQYHVSGSGYFANSIVFDAAGRLVRHLANNAILGLNGYWNWDGLDDHAHSLPIGTYIIFTRLMDLQGKKAIFRNSIVLARKL